MAENNQKSKISFDAASWEIENESELKKEVIGYNVLAGCPHCGESFNYHMNDNQRASIDSENFICPNCNKSINSIPDGPGTTCANSKKINNLNVAKYIAKLNNFVYIYRNASLFFTAFFAILTVLTFIPYVFLALIVALLLLCSVEKTYETLKQTIISLKNESRFEEFKLKSENAMNSNSNFKFDDKAIYDNSNAIFVANKVYMIYKSGKNIYIGLETGKLVKFNSKLTTEQQDVLIMKFRSMNSQILVGKQYKSNLRKINNKKNNL